MGGSGEEQSESAGLGRAYAEVRGATTTLASRLSAEDQMVQSMPDASPTKWHLAHTSWFFETFLLLPHLPGYRALDPAHGFLFNSYYEAVGERHPRPLRGVLSRPSLDEVLAYRRHVDDGMSRLMERGLGDGVGELVVLGLHHEQQHQELLLTDIKHAFSLNALAPSYLQRAVDGPVSTSALRFVTLPGGRVWLGAPEEGFSYDNERPRHEVLLRPFALADRLVSCGEYLAFIEDGGYRRVELWLSDGFDWVRANQISAPAYWRGTGERPEVFTLGGAHPLSLAEPVCHLSFYEADAFARWAGARLPSEAEWELAALGLPVEGNLADRGRLHPAPPRAPDGEGGIRQLFGDVWEWTQSPYVGYPGYRPAAGAVGEYNGKFMCNQWVLRGGSCVSPKSHLRATYRNFFPPSARWQFSGIRLARDA